LASNPRNALEPSVRDVADERLGFVQLHRVWRGVAFPHVPCGRAVHFAVIDRPGKPPKLFASDAQCLEGSCVCFDQLHDMHDCERCQFSVEDALNLTRVRIARCGNDKRHCLALHALTLAFARLLLEKQALGFGNRSACDRYTHDASCSGYLGRRSQSNNVMRPRRAVRRNLKDDADAKAQLDFWVGSATPPSPRRTHASPVTILADAMPPQQGIW